MGASITLPKNTSENEGYCLTLTNDDLNTQCNVFHGDLALIQITPNMPDTMFFCNCKNPGLIGNTSILGACDTPFICNGNINNIDQNIDDIECKCQDSQISTRNGIIPSCRTKNVLQASDSGILDDIVIRSRPDIYLDNTVDIFNEQIVANVNTSKLLNPCQFCPITNREIFNMSIGNLPSSTFCTINYDVRHKSRRNEYFGIPYRRNPTERLLRGSDGPDCILGVYWYEVFVYTRLDEFVQRLVFKFEYHEDNADFYEEFGLTPNERYAIYTDDLLFGVHIPTPEVNGEMTPVSLCWTTWPNYNCSWSQDRVATSKMTYTFGGADIQPITDNSNVFFTQWWQSTPGGFPWGVEPWREMQRLNRFLVFREHKLSNGDEVVYTTLNREFRSSVNPRASDVRAIAWGFRRISESPSDSWRPVFVTNNQPDDFQLVQGRMTDDN
jgi:hypothetical protein